MTKKNTNQPELPPVEELLPGREACKLIASRRGAIGKDGKPVQHISPEALRRYATVGIDMHGKKIVLESVMYPGMRMYSREGIARFLEKIKESSNAHEGRRITQRKRVGGNRKGSNKRKSS